MRSILWFICSLALFSCGGLAQQSENNNRWSDERPWPVFEAQEHRDTDRLCTLLKEADPVVREAAALAFASVQDSAGIPCLLSAMGDSSSAVRATVVYALGFVADSMTTIAMAESAMNERDSTVQRVLLSASFMAMQRNGMLKEPNAIIYYLNRSTGHERVRAADALRRLPDSVLKAIAPDYMTLFNSDTPLETEAMLVRGLVKAGSPEALDLLRFSANPDKPAVIIPNALRALGALRDPADDSLLFAWVGPGGIGQAAVEALAGRETLNAAQCLRTAMDEQDARTRSALLGLAIKHGSGPTVDSARIMLGHSSNSNSDPFLRALIIGSTGPKDGDLEAMMKLMGSDEHPAVRQAALQAAIAIVRERMARSRYASREAQYAELAAVIKAAVSTQDAGLISAAAEALQEEESDAISILFPAGSEDKALAPLEPVRDLEARLLLHKAVAKRDGLPPPAHERPSFNHPIDREKLLALKQGQQYRIVTSKGEIIIATDVNDCPGSSLAFDSLVVAGYYNNKAFHRVVPNFVVQGGCPRGDGYGGMPWTLRTEIGRTPFIAGSVGLASAGPDTESCQFFITHSAAPHLDGRYTRFGEVVSGMDVMWQLQVGDVMTRVDRVD